MSYHPGTRVVLTSTLDGQAQSNSEGTVQHVMNLGNKTYVVVAFDNAPALSRILPEGTLINLDEFDGRLDDELSELLHTDN